MPARRRIRFLVLIIGAFIFASAGSAGPGKAQNLKDSIVSIRALYAQIQEKIATAVREAEGGSPPEFYSTEIFVNSHNGSWRATGTYSRKSVFWYTDQPEFAGGEPGGELSVLAKIEIEEIAGARAFFREFLFDKGSLVFAFVKEPGETETVGEFRYYFQDAALIRYMEGPKIKDSRPDTAALEAEARRLQMLFLSTF